MLKKLKEKIKKITKSPKFIQFLGYALYYYSILVGKTTRWKIHGVEEMYKLWDKEKAIIAIIWHGRALMFPYFYDKKRPLNALVSLHNDGRIIAALLKKYKVKTIGGSTTKGGKEAALGLMSSLEKNHSIAIIPDGPTGPRMKMNESPLYFAKKSGKPIIGATYSIENSFIAKSWDAMMFPFPFNKGIIYLTKPYYVPRNASKEEVEEIRQEIEDELNTLTHKADKQMGIPHVEIGIEKKSKKKKKEKE